MSDLNDERTESTAQRTVAETALWDQLHSLRDRVEAITGENTDVRPEEGAVVVRIGELGTLTMRRGSPIDTATLEQSTIDAITLDETVQAELDAVSRLFDQLDAITMRENRVESGDRPWQE